MLDSQTAPTVASAGVAALCRDLALRMTAQASVTGTQGEASFGPWLARTLASEGRFGPAPEVWTVPVAPDDPEDHRLCVAMLVRGTAPDAGPDTVLLTGHYDTVTVEDYGDLAPLAGSADALAEALLRRVAGAAPGTAEGRAREDLASGRFVPGRGLLDMKAGLAAGLAAMAAFAEAPLSRGNLLFLAVPDEENASAGARAGAAALRAMAEARGLSLRAAVNLDSMADDGDGSEGRVVALGTVGKVLPWAFVVGEPVHSGYPLRGLNAAVLAGALARRLEWAPELTDEAGGLAGTPVSLLSLRDGKAGYDVTTPGTAFATWSVLSLRRDPSEVLDRVEALVREAVGECLGALRERALRAGQPKGLLSGFGAPPTDIPVIRWGQLLAELRERDPGIDAEVEAEARRLGARGASLPDSCQPLAAMLWRRSGRAGPAIVLGLGSTPYLATALGDAAVRAAVEALVAEAPARHGVSIRAVEHFAGISDMSFFGEADAGAFARLATDTPAWDARVGLHGASLAQVPTVNLGPWGRDYHTPLERIEADYGFRVLPALVLDLCGRLLGR